MSETTGMFVGIDVSKARLDVAVHEPASDWQVDNSDAGIAELVQRLQALAPTRIVLEAFVISIGAAAFASLLPARRAGKLDIRDALAME